MGGHRSSVIFSFFKKSSTTFVKKKIYVNVSFSSRRDLWDFLEKFERLNQSDFVVILRSVGFRDPLLSWFN